MHWIGRVFAIVMVCAFACALAATSERIQERRDLRATPPPGRLINIGSHRLHLWCMGHGAPTVLFESALGGTAFDWYAVLQEVSSFATACAYDRAGMGYSDPGPSPRTARHIAGELGALISRSEMTLPVVLVGWSYGGLFVRAYASQREFQVAGLVLVDASHEDQAERFAAAGFPPNVVPWTERWASVAARFGVLRPGAAIARAP